MNRFAPCPQFPEKWKKLTHIASAGTIASAIDGAPPQSALIIPPGVYRESIVIRNRDVHLIGEGSVVLSSSAAGDALTVDGGSVFVTNITIGTGESQCAAPLNVLSGICVLRKCRLQSDFMQCIVARGESRIYLSECVLCSKRSSVAAVGDGVKIEFSMCKLSAERSVGVLAHGHAQLRLVSSELCDCGDSGIVVLDQAAVSVSKSKLSRNRGDAIEINSESVSNVVLGSDIADHENGSGLNCTGKGKLRIENTRISNCICGLFCSNEFTIRSIQCTISDMISSALVYAIAKSTVFLTGDKLQGKCVAGVAVGGQAVVRCEGVSFTDIPATGAAVSGAELVLSRCKFSGVGRIAIEAKEDAKLEVTSTEIEKTGKIGVYMLKNVAGFFKDSSVVSSGEANMHICENHAKFAVSKSKFRESKGSGMRIQNSDELSFASCAFDENEEFGIEIKGEKASMNFSNCTFESNKLIGANIFESAHPAFDSCSFSSNVNSGTSVHNSNPEFNKCIFSKNGEMGLCAFGGSKSIITNSIFKENNLFGSQIENENTLITFKRCEFYDQIETGAIILNNFSSANISKCIIHDNNGPHVECRESSKANIEDSEFYSSKTGIGMIVFEKGFIKASQCNLHSETKASIVVDYEGDCDIDQCEISNCDICGIYFLKDSNGRITNNKIHDNRSVGINVTESSPVIQANTIENHTMCGVHITDCSPIINDNLFIGNSTDVA